ncbi:hypothetical protein EZV62_010839 [Acer yangbiense]|uniref:Nucleolar protein 10 n=1 Tax=Acer yangbiense TaxID=1000413 RepID=A0A5C7I402_9ROSI|nr:hypothetical protein EZV62_010839 [Acer yangbiense]
MYLQFYINDNGDKVYTTKKESPIGLPTQSAHPARFSPDDKYSRQRVLLKKRFGLLPTQKPAPKSFKHFFFLWLSDVVKMTIIKKFYTYPIKEWFAYAMVIHTIPALAILHKFNFNFTVAG